MKKRRLILLFLSFLTFGKTSDINKICDFNKTFLQYPYLKKQNALKYVRRGCCSHHSGVCDCNKGRQVCCDGSYSPTCTCNHNVPIDKEIF